MVRTMAAIGVYFDGSGLGGTVGDEDLWADIVNWEGGLPNDKYLVLHHLLEYGWDDRLPALVSDLEAAVSEHVPAAPVTDGIRELLEIISDRGEEDRAVAIALVEEESVQEHTVDSSDVNGGSTQNINSEVTDEELLAAIRKGMGVETIEVGEVPASQDDGGESGAEEVSNTMEVDMKLNEAKKKEIIEGLVTNCSCPNNVPWKGKDRAALAAMSDESLVVMDECRKALANNGGQGPPRDGFQDAYGNYHVFNQATGRWETTPAHRPQPTPSPAMQPQQQPTQNQGTQTTPTAPVTVPPAPSRPKSMTEALEMFGSAEDKAVWNSAIQLHNQRKADIITQLMAHITDEGQRQQVFNFLNSKSYEELQMELVVHPPASTRQEEERPTANWFGAVGGPVVPQPTTEEALVSPVYNFGRN
jgi:hypothetical protein